MGKKDKRHEEEKILDVDASMQGSLIFKDSVNLRINGNFEGVLVTKGNLMIGETAVVNADITGELVIIAGKVTGGISASKELKLIAPACVIGDIRAPLLSIAEGAVFEGHSYMLNKPKSDSASISSVMTADELAKYLELDSSMILEWANSGKLPATRDGESWKFERSHIDAWLATEKMK